VAIYLTGGGDQEHFQSLDKTFIKELPNGAQIGLLAQATDDAHEAMERVVYYFHDKKIKSIELIENPNTDLLSYDALMIEGGNTFNLIRAVRESRLFSSLKSYAQTNRPIYADSAGAIILGSDVHTAFLGDDGDEDELKLQDYRGLDIINPFCVHAHATADEFDELQDLLYQTGSPILALAEECGVCIKDKTITVYGDHELWLLDFESRKTIPIGESYQIV
jgi:peptidase E